MGHYFFWEEEAKIEGKRGMMALALKEVGVPSRIKKSPG